MVSMALARALPRLATAAVRTITPRLVVSKVGVTNAVPSYARTLAAAATRKTTTTKKTTAKKTPAKKPAAKKAAPKKKPVAKKAAPKKKAVAKKAAPKKPRKVLTEAEKNEMALAKKIKIAKEAALPRQPSAHRLSAFNTYISLQIKASGGKAKLADLAQTYRSLTVQEIQGLTKDAERLSAERAAVNKKWIEQYTPAEIEKANNARRWLKKHGVKRVDVSPIKDHRKILGRRTAFIYYIQAQKDGELADSGSITEKTVAAAKKWKSMSAAEKQPYEDLANADKQRYVKERSAPGFNTSTTIF